MKTYYVYVHHVIDADLYYVGQTCNPNWRHYKSCYIQSKKFYQHIKDSLSKDPNIETSFVYCANTPELARIVEDCFIVHYQQLGKCLNTRRSGYVEADLKKYQREHKKLEYQADPDKFKTKAKQYRQQPENKIYCRVRDFNRRHPNQIKETPLEAKQRYLSDGYIPDYINSSDLQV